MATDKLRYSATSLAFAEEVIGRYADNKEALEASRDTIIFEQISSPTSGEEPVKNSNISNPTLNSVQKLCDDPDMAQLFLSVQAVERTREVLSPEHEHMWRLLFITGEQATDLYRKRVKRFLLSLVCFNLGIPQTDKSKY